MMRQCPLSTPQKALRIELYRLCCPRQVIRRFNLHCVSARSEASEERCLASLTPASVRRSLSTALAVGLSASILWGCPAAAISGEQAASFATVPSSYDAIASKRHKKAPPSNLPTSTEAVALLQLDKDLFTQDAWEGMLKLAEYGKYLDGLEDIEEADKACTPNRLLLEKAWQIVANEFYDAKGQFSQSAWAGQLLHTLQEAGGCLHSRKQTYQALKLMVATLGDRYTQFLGPAQFRQELRRPQPAERDYLEALFTGVGIQLGGHARDGEWLVEGCLAESPAEESGILPGDSIVELDGYPTRNLSRNELLALLRGPSGAAVVLTVARPGWSHRRAVYLERRSLPQPPVKQASILSPSGGRPAQYIRLHYVSSAATKQMAALVRSADKDGASGFILDLRNNPGGVFEEAMAQAALFLEPGCRIAQTVRSQSGVVDAAWVAGDLSSQVFPQQPQRLTAKPVVVLVNSGTASAAEVLSGALHGNHRALLVGQKTFGKGVVQFYFPIDDEGAGLKVTVEKYLGPDGYDISRAGGIVPDITCNDYPHGGLLTATDDKCIAAALRIIKQAAATDHA